MDKRKTFLPNQVSGFWSPFKFWSPFFDTKIQKILNARKTPGDWLFCDTDDHKLAWPIAVFEATTYFATAPGGDEIDFAEDFTNCYALDGEFASALLLALTVYLNEDQPGTNRKFREEDEPFCKYGPPPTWQGVAWKVIGSDSKDAAHKISKIGNKEIKNVKAVVEKWKPHFEAADRLFSTIKSKPHPLIITAYPLAYLPHQNIGPRFLSPKLENK